MEASGEMDKPGIPLDELIKRHGLVVIATTPAFTRCG
jgi:hypothetical protein